MKIGAITIGQAPRVDVTSDILHILPKGIELIQRGALDGLSKEEIKKFAPTPSDYVLVSRLNDGTSVTFAEKYILPKIQEKIYELEALGCRLIIFFCTGSFEERFVSKVPLIYPCDLLNSILPYFVKDGGIACITPSPLQEEQARKKWEAYVETVYTFSASPYEKSFELDRVCDEITKTGAKVVVLDCIGYTQEMKDYLKAKTGLFVVLGRTLLARVVSEFV